MDENTLVMAEALAQSEVEYGIRRAVTALPTQPEGFDGSCVECGDDIPAPRLAFGAVTCISCQTLLEKKRKMFKR